MNFMSKLWVHLRFLIKFIPIQLLGIFLSIYGLVPAAIYGFIFGFNSFFLWWCIISITLTPIAIVLKFAKKLSPLWFMMDDSRYVGDEKAEDFKEWLNDRGGKESFTNLWEWHTRNRVWNLLSLFKNEGEKEYLVELIKNTLIIKKEELVDGNIIWVDYPIILHDEFGFIRYDNFSGLKWITKLGKQGWSINSGVKISWKYTITGILSLYYEINNKLYYKYSTCFKIHKFWKNIISVILLPIKFKWLGKKDMWFTFKYHSSSNLGTIHLKIQWEN